MTIALVPHGKVKRKGGGVPASRERTEEIRRSESCREGRANVNRAEPRYLPLLMRASGEKKEKRRRKWGSARRT